MIDMCKIIHNNYEKITDDVFWLSSKWVIRFNVKLNKYSDKYGRTNYHREVMYSKGNNTCININRSFDYYLSIDSTFKNDSGIKESIYISNTEFYMFKQKLLLASKWFTSSEFDGLFAKKDGKVFMPRGVNGISMRIRDNIIQMDPFIFESVGGEQTIGLNMYINKYDNVFIDVNKFIGLVDCINSFNMFLSAQTMLNYIGKPNPGDNIYDMSSESTDDSRTVFPKRSDSSLGYFNRINKKHNSINYDK